MEGDNILAFNIANWITVVLMVILGFAVIGFVVGATRKAISSDETA